MVSRCTFNDFQDFATSCMQTVQQKATEWGDYTVNWMSTTSSGKLAQTAGWGFLCGLGVIISAFAISGGFSLFTSGFVACSAGAPLGAFSMIGGVALATASIGLIRLSHHCYSKMQESFAEFQQLSRQGV